MSPSDHTATFLDLSKRIAAAARAAGRLSEDVRLTAVSKQQPWSAIAPVLGAGQRVFGENRVQEAMARWGERRAGLELRLIGPLQTNKVRDAIGFFDVIETLDRAKLAERLAREIQILGRAPRLYIQINTGEEIQKAGVSPTEADAFLIQEPPGPHFALLAQIASRHGLSRLSMGMSDDFEVAIGHGATDVRVGSALFGARQLASPEAV
jgi:uncharacterized pyridoxal phosphate-containing UPF0001 family protein